jgi:hypothetical protein
MAHDHAAADAALERLGPFVGEWGIEATFPGAQSAGMAGRVVFEWMLGGRFLVQRSEVSHPDAPDSVAIIGPDPGGETYTYHYFDSRGVVRVYAMTFRDGLWTLLRDTPDFTPLSFSQRFTGTFADDGTAIHGQWEKTSGEGTSWELDFDLTFTRAA